jgi:hypothetical protein
VEYGDKKELREPATREYGTVPSIAILREGKKRLRRHHAVMRSVSTSQSFQVGLSNPFGLELREKPFQ